MRNDGIPQLVGSKQARLRDLLVSIKNRDKYYKFKTSKTKSYGFEAVDSCYMFKTSKTKRLL